jgi:D-sedoheptulose 7-phosphate isomerase
MNEDQIREIVEDSCRTVASVAAHAAVLGKMGASLVDVLTAGGKVLTAGNGGSAAEALHMAEELSGRFRDNRRALPGISLVADPTAMTCIGNDFGFDEIFARQVEALGQPGDLLVLLSTSGSAKNLSRAYESATERGMKTFCLLGRDGGALAGKGDCEIVIDSQATERIQEAHQVVVHLLLEMVERAFVK